MLGTPGRLWCSTSLLPLLQLFPLLLLSCLIRLLTGRLLCRARRDVQSLVNRLGDGLNFCAQLLLNLVKVETVLVGYEVDGQSQVSKSTGSTNTMEICLAVLGEIKVDDDIDGLDINSTREKVRADEVAANTVAEVMENVVTVGLEHFRVRVETRVS